MRSVILSQWRERRMGALTNWSEKVRCSSKMKPRFRAEWEVSSV